MQCACVRGRKGASVWQAGVAGMQYAGGVVGARYSKMGSVVGEEERERRREKRGRDSEMRQKNLSLHPAHWSLILGPFWDVLQGTEEGKGKEGRWGRREGE